MTTPSGPTPPRHLNVRIRTKPIEVSRVNPLAEDLLERHVLLKKLLQFITAIQTPFVMAVDSPWGTGKTKFLEMLEVVLEEAGTPVVRFNAWEVDFAEEPLGPVLGALRKRFPQAREPLLDKGKRVIKSLALAALPAILKAGTAGLLDIRDATSRFEDAEDSLADAVEKAAERQIEAFEGQDDEIQGLREVLRRLASEHAGAGKRVVIMIDELDRCRPSFAVELLERVKHVLEVEGFVFVLALHRSELASAVKAVYGDAFDGLGYLGRFFDCAFRLPNPDRARFARSLAARSGLGELLGSRGTNDEREAFVDSFAFLADCLSLSLREIEQALARLIAVLLTVKPEEPIEPDTKVLLTMLAQCRPELYEGLTSSPDGASQISEILDLKGVAARSDDAFVPTMLEIRLLGMSVALFGRPSARVTKYAGDLREVKARLDSPGLDAEEETRLRRLQQFLEYVIPRTQLGRIASGPVRRAMNAIAFTSDFHFQDEATEQ